MLEEVMTESSRDSVSTDAVVAGPGERARLQDALYGEDGCIVAILAGGEGMVVHVGGSCMAPVLADRQSVRIEPARALLPGDVAVVRSGDGRLLAHRFLGYVWSRGRWKGMTMADVASCPDPLADCTRLLGKVVEQEGRRHVVAIRHRLKAMRAYAYWSARGFIQRLRRRRLAG